MTDNEIYHLNDRTMKYLAIAQSKRQHRYLGLPGNFKSRLPQEIVFPNMDIGRADEYYLTDNGLLVNLEEESGDISEKTLKKFSRYVVFACDRYNGNVYLAVLCHKDPKKDFEYFHYTHSIIIKVHYYFFTQEELRKKYENVISKVEQKEQLTEMEALDIAFVSKFVSREYAPEVVQSLTKAFKKAIIEDKLLKIDVGVILGAMILKHIKNIRLQNKLLGDVNMGEYENELHDLVYDEYGDILDKKDEEIFERDEQISERDEQISKYKNMIDKLKDFDDFNSPEAKKIINRLMLIGK